MEKEEDFDTLIKRVHQERVLNKRLESYQLDKYAQKEYYYFVFWCAANNVTESVDAFKSYLEKENKVLPYVVKKWIAENRFGYGKK